MTNEEVGDGIVARHPILELEDVVALVLEHQVAHVFAHALELLDEAARFLVYKAADYPRGLDLATLALELNPISPDLWNTYGDALYYLGRMAEARSAIDEALRRNPENPRALLSLAYVHAAQRDPRAALRAIADGLHHDHSDAYRKRLLAEQQTILDALSRRREQRRKAEAARAETHAFVEDDGPPEAPPSGDAPGS